jgi:antitoxin component YwqK of YwqJK toxin-antitoxin module
MKKTVFILFAFAAILSACHSNNNPTTVATNPNSVTDTSKIHAAPQQTPDTSVKKDGLVEKRYPNGVIKEHGYYVGGRRQGECQSFYSNGKLWSDDYFANGVLDGSTTSYYDNGNKRYEGTYTNGKPSGTWKFYDNSGKLTRTTDYTAKGDKPAI